MVKLDRRVRRTRRLLGEALLELIRTKNFDAITIRDITDQADVGYATFFRHYDSKEDLLAEQLAQIVRQLEEVAGQRSEDYFQREGTLFFEHVQAHEHLYQGLLSGHVSVQVVRRMRDSLVKVIKPHMASHDEAADVLVPLDIAANHIASSALELAAWWLDNDMPYSTTEMGLYYQWLIIEGTWQAILPQRSGSGKHEVIV
jgi:AcrR family transcriptional regulator